MRSCETLIDWYLYWQILIPDWLCSQPPTFKILVIIFVKSSDSCKASSTYAYLITHTHARTHTHTHAHTRTRTHARTHAHTHTHTHTHTFKWSLSALGQNSAGRLTALWQEADGDRNKWERCSHAPGLSPGLWPVIIRQGCPLRSSDYGAFPLEGNYGERTWPMQLGASVLQVFSKVFSESLAKFKCRSTELHRKPYLATRISQES